MSEHTRARGESEQDCLTAANQANKAGRPDVAALEMVAAAGYAQAREIARAADALERIADRLPGRAR